MITSLNDEYYPYVVSDNAKRFLKFISKLAWQKIRILV
jgi:hypothetical protein